MRLFNTLSQQVEELRPLGEAVTLYVCGVTPYDTTHLGHASINVVYDTLRRYLNWRGQPVKYVQNVTDIDDDILRKAKERGLAWDELGRQETERYLTDLRDLNVAPPDYFIKASDETAMMIELIQTLLVKNLAYERDGWVYFRVKADPDFGRLAAAAGYIGYDAWLLTANERGNFPNDPRKEDPLDFVLWQAQQPGEPAWPSPWGPGRPGWHIECSSMAVKYLGPRIDIHGGGSDLVFPHHTCEIAQSENATGERPFVSIWMHCAMVGLDGEKMSKSLGNLVLARDLLNRYSADAIRVMILSHHYRTPWEYSEHEMQERAAFTERLRLGDVAGVAEDTDEIAAKAEQEYIAAMENDLDTPRALDVLARLAEYRQESASAAAQVALQRMAAILGLTGAAARTSL
jgi:L-cysteine:1D-myo-inositol 2-amino-2-deoxy-alpha-D-glucopyranoside ligase